MKINRSLTFLFIIIFILPNLFCQDIYAKESRTVKVGCVDIDNFFTIEEDGHAEGYAVEYLNAIAEETGWTYEYIPGSWSDCMEWAKTGQIDLLMPAEYSDERAKDYLFSQEECCMDYAALICMINNDELYYNDPESYNGLRVGMIENNFLNSLFEEYVLKNSLTVERFYYKNGQDLETALESGQVDAVVSGNMQPRTTEKLLARFGYMPAYFITSKENPALMDELNDALSAIKLNNPYYSAKLHEKYYGDIEKQSAQFTKEEVKFIQSHKEIPVIYDNNNHPLEWYNEKEQSYEGLYPELMRLIQQQCGLNFTISNLDKDHLPDQINDGAETLVASVCENYKLSKNYKLSFTRAYYNLPYALIAKKGSDFLLDGEIRVSVIRGQEGINAYLARQFPRWTLIECESNDECIQNIFNGKSEAVFMSSFHLQSEEYLKQYEELVNVSFIAPFVPISIGVSGEHQDILVSILNKAILKLDENTIENYVISSMLNSNNNLSLIRLLRTHPVWMLAIGVLLAALIIFLILQIHYNKVQTAYNRQLEEKNILLEIAAKREQTLRKMAETDKLTGLLNKATTERLCQKYLNEDQEPGVIMITDIDHFKQINDTMGHLYGDQVLSKFGKILCSCCGKEDIIGRIGGDEFLICVKGHPDDRSICKQADRILSEFENLSAPQCSFSCSIGIARYPEHASTYQEVFSCADQALYCAKDHGRGCFYIHPDSKAK